MTDSALTERSPSARSNPSRLPARMSAAIVVDGIGTGMFLPFSVLFFVHVAGLPVAEVGACLTGASLLALPTPMVTGPLVDRFGPLPLVVAGNVLGAAGYAVYPWVGGAWQLVAAAFLTACGQSVFWTANTVLIARAASPQGRAGWFARQSAARNAGYGLGALAGAGVVVADSRTAYLLLAAVNAASCLAAAALFRLSPLDRAARGVRQDDTATAHGSYRTVLRQRNLLLLTAAGFGLVLCMNVLPVLLTSYLTKVLGRWVFLGGLAVTANTVLVVVGQTWVTGRVRHRAPVRVVQAAAIAWAAAFLCLWALAVVPWWVAAPCLLVAVAALTLAEMLYGPTVNALAAQIAPAGAEGRHLAVFQLSWSVGSALAPAALTGLLSAGPGRLWAVLLGVCAVCAAALGPIPATRPAAAPPP